MNLWCNQVHNVPLVFPEIQVGNTLTPGINGFGFAPPTLGKTLVSFTAIDMHLQMPRIQQASFSFEHQLSATTMVQAGYLGAWGVNLDRARLVNNAQPGPGGVQPRRPYPTASFAPGTELPSDIAVSSLTFPVGPINLLDSIPSTSTRRTRLSTHPNSARSRRPPPLRDRSSSRSVRHSEQPSQRIDEKPRS